jgi:hypothetical protein
VPRPETTAPHELSLVRGEDTTTQAKQETAPVADRAAARHGRAKELAALADDDRAALEELRLRFQRRIHRRSDDFDAAEELRTVELALSMTPRPEGLYSWQRLERGQPRRWWRRRRKHPLNL